MTSTTTSVTPSVTAALIATLGDEVVKKIRSSKILLVGAGGIGTELLKNLALMGFRHVQVIDLDTIDQSNLNRQLLFRSQHVGMSKCKVACQVAMDMMPEAEKKAEGLQPVTYEAYHGNVCDNDQFNVHFVEQFDLVLNALDNVTARRRVNRLCLAAAVPLVEAGTTGYLGQVNVMDKASGVACYECTTQETQKVYPICTIRSTPSMPVHTIVWAKELYKLLFAEKLEESMLYEDPAGEEPSTYMQAVMNYRNLLKDRAKEKSEIIAATQALLKTLYIDEIQKQLNMDRYKAAKNTPAPLSAEIITTGSTMDTPPSKTKATDVLWTPTECAAEMAACLVEAHKDPAILLPAFDKDDDLAMRLVTAASNLRSHVFHIVPLQSLYSAKGIAGNIIPAIATTNAIVSGLQMIQVVNILRAQLQSGEKGGNLREHCQYINCIRQPTRNGLYLTASKLNPPNPNCFVCRQASVPLTINIKNWTLEKFLARVVKKELGFEEPILALDGVPIWEEGQNADNEAYEQNLAKTLTNLPGGGIKHGTVLEIEDFTQNLEVNICIAHREEWEGEEYDDPEQQFVIGGEKPKVAAMEKKVDESVKKAVPLAMDAASAKAPAVAAKDTEESDSDIEAWDFTANARANTSKRTVEDNAEDDGPLKKHAKVLEDGNGKMNGRISTTVAVELIEIDD